MARKSGTGIVDGGEVATATATAAHLDVARSFLDKLEGSGVIARLPGGGYNLTAARTAYIRHLRQAKVRSPKADAEAEFLRQKSAALEIRTMQRLGQLVPSFLLDETVDVIVGAFRAELNMLFARYTRDNIERRKLETLIRDLLTRVANEAGRRAGAIEAAKGDELVVTDADI